MSSTKGKQALKLLAGENGVAFISLKARHFPQELQNTTPNANAMSDDVSVFMAPGDRSSRDSSFSTACRLMCKFLYSVIKVILTFNHDKIAATNRAVVIDLDYFCPNRLNLTFSLRDTDSHGSPEI